MPKRKIQKPHVIHRVGHKVHKIVAALVFFSVFALIVSMVADPELFFKAEAELLDSDGNAACNFTSTYIPQKNWKDYVNLPSLDGPEDAYGIMGIELECSETECPAATCSNESGPCKDGYISRRSIARTTERIPYSVKDIEILLVESSPDTTAVVTIGGEVNDGHGVINTSNQFTGTVKNEGDIITNIDRSTSNLSLFAKNTNSSPSGFKKGGTPKCAIAIFKFKTDFTSKIKGKVTGTKPGEENGIDSAKVTLSPCPYDDRKNVSGEFIRTIPQGESCEIYTDSSGNYNFSRVLPIRSYYEVKAVRQ